jgi:branched-chain amino acid aminotransferase
MQVWIDGELVDKDQAKVSVYDHGFLYGDGVFEGIRAYNGRILKLKSHLDRLAASAKSIHLTMQYTMREIEQAVRQTVEANGLKDAYIRLVVSRGAGTLGLNPFNCPKPCTVVIVGRIQLYPPEMYENGMLTTDGQVAECTGDNIFFVRGDRILTPPVSAGILNGVTRNFVMNEIAPQCGIAVEERSMRLEDIYTADEVFLTGTAAEVIGVSSIDGEAVADGKVGPVTRRLIACFRSRVEKDAPED